MPAPRQIVVDASVALKWIFEEDHSDWARRLLTGGHDLLAPTLLWTECTNVFWRIARSAAAPPATRHALLPRIITTGFDVLRAAPIRIAPLDLEIHEAAAQLGRTLDHPTYDCIYLAMTLRDDAMLATADARFRRALGRAAALPPDRLLTPPG